jgi:hypothetical protein
VEAISPTNRRMSQTSIVKALRTPVVVAEIVLRVPETAVEIEGAAGVPEAVVEDAVVAVADAAEAVAVVVAGTAEDMVDTVAVVGAGTRPFATDSHGSSRIRK